MQILGIANTMFSKLNERESNKYHITTYNVTPLGPRAGLIQMVEDATSLFTLFKRHQIRSKNSAELNKSRYKSATNVETTDATIVSEEGHPVRPTDIYWQKLRPKLDLAKLDPGLDNRDKWPSSILIEVLNELKYETPSDLLSKELWCCSINSSNWFRSSISFTRSCAVMSIMGNIIGLGDRHLDNLLVNLSTGQIVHIDYNVCFDKGTSLKVPEKVPFRLTDIMTDVFGPVGVEGMFKISCENVMQMVQQSQGNILTLMDTFVLDPIVDWSSGIESGHYGSFDGGKFAVNSVRSVVEKRCVEFKIGLNNFQSALITMEEDLKNANENLSKELNTLHTTLEKNLEICVKVNDMKELCKKKNDMIIYLDAYKDEEHCDLLDHVNYVKTIESRCLNINMDLEKRMKQMNLAISEHGSFFNVILSNSEFISFTLDVKNLKSFFDDNMTNIKKNMKTYFDVLTNEDQLGYTKIMTEARMISVNMESLQESYLVFDKYRNLLNEMPEYYFNSDRCTYMIQVTKNLVEDKSISNFNNKMNEYQEKWVAHATSEEINQFLQEKKNWYSLLKLQSHSLSDVQMKITTPSNDEEIQHLESIWQLTMYENMGINVFKAVLLEQYLEMANAASQIDTNIAKIPDQISLSVDYNDTLRRYLQLVNYHDNYFKILSNCMNVFGIYLNINEANAVCSMMTSLQKVCIGLASFESNFIEIIMPESIKIMKNLSMEDEDLLDQLQVISKESENIILHFNIALTSTSYDINNYEYIHTKTVVPLKERMAKLTDITNISMHDTSKQLRVLIASFYTTIHQTYQLVCDFIDSCINSSTPSSWNYLDLVVASGLNISPMWNKSHTLLKDALYMTSIRSLINTLDHSRNLSKSIKTAITTEELNNIFCNMQMYIELYFNFINRHILYGVGSQCFGKMFCLLLEFAGWNIDAMIAENMQNCAISAEYICGSVSSFRKTEYPNAANFYTQLQFRFNSYKNLTGFSTEPHLSTRFLSRNMSVHKSIYKLAKNQLISMTWINKDSMIETSSEKMDELSLISDLESLLKGVPDKISLVRTILLSIDAFENDLHDVDLNIQKSWSEETFDRFMSLQKEMISERSTVLTSLRNRLCVVKEALINLDRFECLRSKSERAREFDKEIIQFLGDTKTLLEDEAKCSGMIKPIEEEIIVSMKEYCCDSDSWWINLRKALQDDVTKTVTEQREHNVILNEIRSLYDQELKHLKTVLTNHYYPLTSQLKPTLRVLHSITRKLKSYVWSNDFSALNQTILKSQFVAICKLMGLFERFSSIIDVVTATSQEDCDNLGFLDRLRMDYGNIGTLRNEIVPDLFTLFHSLSPHFSTEDGLDLDNLSMFGFSNNNMAETNGDNMARISPTFSEDDMTMEARPCFNDGDNQLPDMGPYTGDQKYINNSTGVQRAVEVWKLVESRMNMTNIAHKRDDLTESEQSSKEAISHYVDKCIRTARNPDNLARMYEGWTAWV